jgi:hypothetical protein
VLEMLVDHQLGSSFASGQKVITTRQPGEET